MNWTRDADRPLGVELEIAVRGYDIDAGRHVSNIAYARWLDDIRATMLEAYCPLETLLAEGLTPVLKESRLVYKRPIGLFDTVAGRGWVEKLEDTDWALAFLISANGQVAASATQVGCFVGRNGRPAPVPDQIVKAFTERGEAT